LTRWRQRRIISKSVGAIGLLRCRYEPPGVAAADKADVVEI